MMHRVLRLTLAGLLVCSAAASLAQGLRLPGATLPVPGSAADPAQAPVQRASDYIVAVVNSEPITHLQLRMEMQRTAQQIAQQQRPVPQERELGQLVLERLISERVQIQMAREVGVKVDEFAIDEAIQSIARQNQIEASEMYRRLAVEGVSRSQFRVRIADQLLLSRVREREVVQRVRVSELDIDRYLLDQKRDSGGAVAALRLAHVLLALPEGATGVQVAAAQAQAQQVLLRAQKGADFAALARELSAAPDAAAGGDLGLRAPDRYPVLFAQAVSGQAVGALAIVQSGAGIHVLKLLEKRAEGALAMSVQQTRASHLLLRTSASLSEAAAVERLRAVRQRIEAGQADFATMAKENSQDGSADQGGDLGWIGPGQLVPEFEDAMDALAPGQIGEPLVSRFGVHLIKVVERRTVPLSEREQREAIRAMLREKKIDEAYRAWAGELRARAYVDLREPPG